MPQNWFSGGDASLCALQGGMPSEHLCALKGLVCPRGIYMPSRDLCALKEFGYHGPAPHGPGAGPRADPPRRRPWARTRTILEGMQGDKICNSSGLWKVDLFGTIIESCGALNVDLLGNIFWRVSTPGKGTRQKHGQNPAARP